MTGGRVGYRDLPTSYSTGGVVGLGVEPKRDLPVVEEEGRWVEKERSWVEKLRSLPE